MQKIQIDSFNVRATFNRFASFIITQRLLNEGNKLTFFAFIFSQLINQLLPVQLFKLIDFISKSEL